MGTRRHKLTTGGDRINGGDGSDLFLGAALKSGVNLFSTLTSNDRLNGGGGVDTVRADLVKGLVSPLLENIEVGILALARDFPITLDLARAAEMRRLVLSTKNDVGANSQADTLFIENAAKVDTVEIRGVAWQTFHLSGTNTKIVRDMSVDFHHDDGATLDLQSANPTVFDHFSLTLNNSQLGVITGDFEARSLTIHSLGADGFHNHFWFTPADQSFALPNLKTLVIDGGCDVELSNLAPSLRRFDASHATGNVWMDGEIGGSKLMTVRGGSGDDRLHIGELGGTGDHRAQVMLGKGDDSLYLFYMPHLDGRIAFIDGGAGYDTVTVADGISALAKLTANVEELDVPVFRDPINFSGCHFDTVAIGGPNSLQATQLKHFSIDTRLAFTDSLSWGSATLTVQIDGAAASIDEKLDLLFDKSGHAGDVGGGVFLPNLSAAHIELDDDGFFYLGTIGAADDSAEITITGDHRIWMGTATGSTSYIDRIVAKNGASVDLSGMTHGDQAFLATGATIIGGAGDDVLVGGAGADAISTGGGNNTVLGSLGSDSVTLVADSGQDMLEFTHQGQSAFGSGHDTIDNFGIFDGIDLSAIGTAVTYAGTVANMSAGMAKLSASHATAFFNAADHTLYVDLDHDQQFLAADDMQVQLNGVSSLQSANVFL